jgi:hypothetical protein
MLLYQRTAIFRDWEHILFYFLFGSRARIIWNRPLSALL